MANSYTNSFKYKLIYIFGIPDEAHKGVLKIGEATVDTDLSFDHLNPNCSELNKAARERELIHIQQQLVLNMTCCIQNLL